MCVDREVSKMESGRDLEWGQGNRTNFTYMLNFTMQRLYFLRKSLDKATK